MKTAYIIKGAYNDNGTWVSSNNPETLGEAYGRTFSSYEEAEDAVEFLREELDEEEADLIDYAIEEVLVEDEEED